MMLRFDRMGRDGGTPIVFLHGVGISSWMWRDVAAQLPDADAILIDLPGHGRSRDIRWTSLSDTAAQVVAVMDHLGLEQAQLVALSLGGYVALEALAADPERFHDAVISGVHAGGMPNQTMMVIMSALMAPLAGLKPFSARTAKMLGDPNVDIAAFQIEAAKTRVSAFRRASINATRFELPEGLGRYCGGLTICCGEKEHPLIRDALPIIAGLVPQTRTFVAEGGGHGWPVVERDRFVPLIEHRLTASIYVKGAQEGKGQLLAQIGVTTVAKLHHQGEGVHISCAFDPANIPADSGVGRCRPSRFSIDLPAVLLFDQKSIADHLLRMGGDRQLPLGQPCQ